MRKIYLSLFSLLAFATLQTQAFNVTFQLDANTLAISPNGIHIAGSFQGWDTGATALTDDNCDFIYEVTLDLAAGDYQFKFINGNAWGSEETAIPATCSDSGNRTLTVTGDQTYGPMCFNDCGPCMSTMPVSVPVTLRVDMTNETVAPEGVFVAGDFQEAAGLGTTNWTPANAPMSDNNGDNVYEISFNVPQGCYNYKFVNGTGGWENDPNRTFGANDLGYDQMAVCFNSNIACPTTVNYYDLTFQVDMSRVSTIADMAAAAGISGFSLDDTISIAGNFQGDAGQTNWTPGATQLIDDNGDKIYTLTVNIPEGTYQYKFINGTSWGVAESVPGECGNGGNRQVVLSENTVLPVICFGYCDANCPAALPPVDVTFRVDMSETVVNAGGLFVAGSFQRPNQWDKTSMQMTDPDEDGIYEYTYTIFPGSYQYKYFNGPGGDADGETADFVAQGCGVPNGIGGSNRVLDAGTFTEDYLVTAYKYNTCIESIAGSFVGIENNIAQIEFNASPNPFSNATLIQFNNPNNDTYKLVICDITGKVAQQINNIKGNSVSVNRGNMPAGLYYATLSNNKGEYGTQKLLID
jgi:hypothetical protein